MKSTGSTQRKPRGASPIRHNGAAIVNPVPLRKLDMTVKALTPNPQTDAELLASATKRLARVKECLASDDDADGLRAEMIVPLLKKAIDDAQTLLTRMKG